MELTLTELIAGAGVDPEVQLSIVIENGGKDNPVEALIF